MHKTQAQRQNSDNALCLCFMYVFIVLSVLAQTEYSLQGRLLASPNTRQQKFREQH